ncbi:hypothetical protein SM007_37420 [Streptomyces avermitilis]|nr:hypothetical protein SM007_37420 [Streptomyces avermitilis]
MPQRAVIPYEPGRALRSMVTRALAELCPAGLSRVVGKTGEETVLPLTWHLDPSTVIVSCPPRAMTLDRATILLGSLKAAAVGAASPTARATAAPAARAREVRM